MSLDQKINYFNICDPRFIIKSGIVPLMLQRKLYIFPPFRNINPTILFINHSCNVGG